MNKGKMVEKGNKDGIKVENYLRLKQLRLILKTYLPPMMLISLQHINIAYEGRPVLSDFSLDVHSGDFIVLRGQNGGGKTSLLKVMVGLLPPVAGRVERAPGLTLGYLPQYRSIDRRFPITVEQTVRSGLLSQLRWWQRYTPGHGQQVQSILQRFGLEALARQPIEALSGGQWQRTLLARALVSQPHLLLLDEPDTHLDNATKSELYATLVEEHTQRAIVVVSHDAHFPHPAEARIVDV